MVPSNSMKKLSLKFIISNLIAIIGILCVIFYIKSIYRTRHLSNKRMISSELRSENTTKAKDVKRILFWRNLNSFEYSKMGEKIVGKDFLTSLQCPVTNCIFSDDRNFLPTEYDAIVFHVGNSFDIIDMPKIRSDDQLYIMANQESPDYTAKHDLKYENNFFNITFTYRLDSDIYWGYGRILDVSKGTFVAPLRTTIWRDPEVVNDPEIFNLINSKTKLAAWIVSHCGAFSNRDILAKNLQKFINIDTYGRCGNLKCLKSSNECDENLNSTYKFYLAFENSLCIDYMTEKVFENMQKYIVPIVYNGVTNMSNFLPPHSYINVNDFSNIEELANYLKFLDENPQEYANYFWWKKYYKIVDLQSHYSYCEMCMMINRWDLQNKRQTYYDIDDWYSRKMCINVSESVV